MGNDAERHLAETLLRYKDRPDPEGQAIAKVLEALAVADRRKDASALREAAGWARRTMRGRSWRVQDLQTGEEWRSPETVVPDRHQAAESMAEEVRRRLDLGESWDAITWWMVLYLQMHHTAFGVSLPEDPWSLVDHIRKRIASDKDEERWVLTALRACGMPQTEAKNVFSFRRHKTDA